MKTIKNKNKYFKALIAIAISFTIFNAGNAFASPVTNENVLNLINQERSANRLAPLKESSDLDNAAFHKSKDMINRQYFEHYAFGLTPWDFIINSGYEYLSAGENLAMDFQTSEGMVNAWMDSPAHRANILNPDFEDIGIGVIKGEFTENGASRSTTMVTNMFGREKPAIVKIFQNITNAILNHIF